MFNKRLKFLLSCFSVLAALLLTSCAENAQWQNTSAFLQKSFKKPSRELFVQKPRPVVKWAQHKKILSEKLLDVEGHWNLVEQSQSYDPAEAHLRARKNVNIKRRSKNRNLSAHFEPDAKSGQDGKLRILRLEPQNSIFGNDNTPNYELAGSTVVKPTHMVAGSELLKEVSLLLDFGQSVVRPPELPARRKVVALVQKNAARVVNGEQAFIPRRKPLMSITQPVHEDVEVLANRGSIIVIPLPRIKPHRSLALKRVRPAIVKAVPKAKEKVVFGKVSNVNNLRSGIHSGNTRIVIEVSHTTKYKVAIDSLRNVFRVKLINTKWDIAPQGNLSGSPLLGSYVTRKQKDGSVLLEIRLKNKAKIVKAIVLGPNLNSNHRVVIDLQG